MRRRTFLKGVAAIATAASAGPLIVTGSHDRPDAHDLRQHVGRELDGRGGSRLLQAVHRRDGHPRAHGRAGVVRQAEGPGAERQLRVGRHRDHPGRAPARRARRAGGAGRLDGRAEGEALPERRVRQRPRLLRARHQPRLPQGQVPAGRPEDLGRLLGRQEVPRQPLDAQQRGAHACSSPSSRTACPSTRCSRSTSTAPSASSTRSSRTSRSGGRRATSHSSSSATAKST